MAINDRTKAAIGGALVGLALLGFTARPIFAQGPAPTPNRAPTHAQMDAAMDAMYGAGTSQRMHAAMGPQGEQLMDQCVGMMGAMQNMSGMGGMMNGQSMQGMMQPAPSSRP